MKKILIKFIVSCIILCFFANSKVEASELLKENLNYLRIERLESRHNNPIETIIELKGKKMFLSYSGVIGKSYKDLTQEYSLEELVFFRYDKVLIRSINHFKILYLPKSINKMKTTKSINRYRIYYKKNKKTIRKVFFVYDLKESVSESYNQDLYNIYLFDAYIDKCLSQVFEGKIWE